MIGVLYSARTQEKQTQYLKKYLGKQVTLGEMKSTLTITGDFPNISHPTYYGNDETIILYSNTTK